MTLSELKQDAEAELLGPFSNNNPHLDKVEAMGLRSGAKIIIRKIQGRNIVVKVKDLGVELVIDKELAGMLEVS